MSKTLIGIIIGILLSGFSVFAYSVVSNDISYKPKNEEFEVDNVDDALTMLYDNYDNKVNTINNNVIANNYNGNALNNAGSTINLTKGNYIVLGVSATSFSSPTINDKENLNSTDFLNPIDYNGCDCKILNDNGSEKFATAKADTNSYIGSSYLTMILKCYVKTTCSISMLRKYNSYEEYMLNTTLKAIRID